MPRTASSSVASAVAGRAVRDARRRVGLSQRELAGRLGGSATYISALENGRTNPTIGQLFAVASALGLEFELAFHAPDLGPEPLIPPPAAQRGAATA